MPVSFQATQHTNLGRQKVPPCFFKWTAKEHQGGNQKNLNFPINNYFFQAFLLPFQPNLDELIHAYIHAYVSIDLPIHILKMLSIHKCYICICVLYMYLYFVFYKCIILCIYIANTEIRGTVDGSGSCSSHHVICSVLGGHFSFPLFELLASYTRSLSPTDSGLEVLVKLCFQCYPVVHSP